MQPGVRERSRASEPSSNRMPADSTWDDMERNVDGQPGVERNPGEIQSSRHRSPGDQRRHEPIFEPRISGVTETMLALPRSGRFILDAGATLFSPPTHRWCTWVSLTAFAGNPGKSVRGNRLKDSRRASRFQVEPVGTVHEAVEDGRRGGMHTGTLCCCARGRGGGGGRDRVQCGVSTRITLAVAIGDTWMGPNAPS